MNRASLLLALSLLAACAPASEGDEPATTEEAITGDPGSDDGPNVARHYIQYNSNFAFQNVVLHRDGSYHVLRGQDVFTGTWSFNLPTSKVTLTPSPNSAPPPELEYPVKRVDCDPSGWYPVLMRGDRKLIPYGIDPKFDEQYCKLWSPTH